MRKKVIFWSVLALGGVLAFVWFASSLSRGSSSGFWDFILSLSATLAFVFWAVISMSSYQDAEIEVIDSFRTTTKQ